MKNLIITLTMLCGILIFSCKKNHNGNGSSGNLPLIQHKWMLVSVNGEALRYVGTVDDYLNFATDGFLCRYVNKIYDTSSYTLLPDNVTIALYPIMNGAKTGTFSNCNIKVLTDSQFVFGNFNTITYSLDSLKR